MYQFCLHDRHRPCALGKDLTWLVNERMSVIAFRQLVRLPKEKKRGDLMPLKNASVLQANVEHAGALLSLLVRIYELRKGDARLPVKDSGKVLDWKD